MLKRTAKTLEDYKHIIKSLQDQLSAEKSKNTHLENILATYESGTSLPIVSEDEDASYVD